MRIKIFFAMSFKFFEAMMKMKKKLVIVLCNEWFGRKGNHGPLDSILDSSDRTENESYRFRGSLVRLLFGKLFTRKIS